MDESIPTVTAADTAVPPVLDADNLIKVFTQFLSFDVADGAASGETIIAYWSQVKAYLGLADKGQNPSTKGDRSYKKLL